MGDDNEENHSFMQALRAMAAGEFQKSKDPVRKRASVQPLKQPPSTPKSPSPGKPAFTFWEERDDVIDLASSSDDEGDGEDRKLEVCLERFYRLW